METVSVIMPCYNDGKYIETAIASVRAQTYPEVELIVIDDGSDDPETLEILDRLEGVRLLRTEHLHPAGARNAGIQVARGSYILPLDSDDIIEPTYIEQAVQVMEEAESVGVVYCHANLFDSQTGPWNLPDYDLDKMLLDNIVFVSALFRKEDWERTGGFRTSMRHGMEDYDFWLSILELGREIRQLPEVLFHYRIKPVSRTSRFLEDPSVVKETYRMIYTQHPVLYERYKDRYAMILRDALIDQLFLNRVYQKSLGALERLKKIPLLKGIVKKMMQN